MSDIKRTSLISILAITLGLTINIGSVQARFAEKGTISAATIQKYSTKNQLASTVLRGPFREIAISTGSHSTIATAPTQVAAKKEIQIRFKNQVTFEKRPTVAAAPKFTVTPNNYNLFHSVVIPVGKLAAFDQWSNIAPHPQTTKTPICAETLCSNDAGKRLASAATTAQGLAPIEALQLINTTVNQTIKYRSDQGDQWASLTQTAARGYGDCEDFAIAKMELLSRIGFAPEQLQFVVLKDTRRQLYHAVLAVHVEGKRYVLDNLSNVVASDSVFRSYMPIASFVGGKKFIHGFVEKTIQTASLGKDSFGKGGLAAIRLGSAS